MEIQEATKGISVSLSLHHSKCLLIVGTFSMHWTSSDMHLLILTVFHILLILHVLEVLKVLIFLLVVWILFRGSLLLGWWPWTLSLLTSSIDVVRLDLEVLLLFVSWS